MIIIEQIAYLWQENNTAAATVSLTTNQVWTGSRERIDMIDRCGGYWGRAAG